MSKYQNYTQEEVFAAYKEAHGNLTGAAKLLTAHGRGDVSRQFVRSLITRYDSAELGGSLDRAAELVRTRNAQASNNTLRRDNRQLIEAVGTKESFFDAIDFMLTQKGPRRKRWAGPTAPFVGAQAGTPMTVELLLSDLQIGKLSSTYNSQVALARLREYARVALFQIEQKRQAGYRIEKIVLALIGDIIESDKKHENSGKATDSTTAEQIYDATTGIFELVVEPLAKLGIEMEVIGIVGNHDWDGHGMNMFMPGRSMLSYPVYRLIEKITERAGYVNVRFNIPDGTYTTSEFYGQVALYEHGYGVANNEAALKKHKVNRSEQEQRHITYLRVGDKHTVTSFNSGQLVVNGAFFGSGTGGGEYSEIAGYSSIPAQVMLFHVPRKGKAMLTVYDMTVIQLGHVA